MSMSAARRHRRASRRHRARVRAVVASWMFDGFSRRQARILERTMRMLVYPPTMPTDPADAPF